MFGQETFKCTIPLLWIIAQVMARFMVGDTNKDGNLSLPKNGNAYFRGTGNILVDPSAELKYLTITRSGTLTANETWLGGQVYHITGTVTVPSGVTLTIMPGAIIKFGNNCSLIVNTGGTLIAEGNSAQPIIFTSIRDLEYGAEVNDGGTKPPQPGDWHQIYARGGTVRMDHTRVYFGNNSESGVGCLEVDSNGQFIFNNSILSFTKHCGIRSESGSFNAYNSVISESPLAINLHGGTNNNFINCTIANVTNAVREWQQGNFVNCVIAYVSSAFNLTSTSATYSNCVFWNPKGFGQQSYRAVGTNGNFWADPMLYDAANGDDRLRPGSPLIDAGDGKEFEYRRRQIDAATVLRCCSGRSGVQLDGVFVKRDFHFDVGKPRPDRHIVGLRRRNGR